MVDMLLKGKKQSIILFLTLIAIAVGIPGCSQEGGGGTPAGIWLVYVIVSAVVLLGFIVTLIFLINENTRIRKQQKSQEAILSTIYDIFPDMVFTKDRNAVFTSCNRFFEQLHKLKQFEIVGKTTADLFPGDFYEDRGQIQQIKDMDNTVLTEKRPVKGQGWRTYPDGTRKFMEIIRVPLFEDGEVTGLLGIARDLTEFRTLFEQYERQATTLSAIYNAVVDVIFTKDKNGVYTSCNHVFTELHGRSESELIGKSTDMLYQDKGQAQQVMNSDYMTMHEKKPVREQVWLTFDSGANKFFETIKVPLIQDGEVTGVLGIGRDLTEFKKILDEYKNQATTLSAIYNALPDVVFIKNRDGVFTSCNNAFEKLHGLKESEVIGKMSHDLYQDTELIQHIIELDHVVFDEKTPVREQSWRTLSDGSVKFLETIRVPLIQEGEITGLLGIGRDLTDFKTLLEQYKDQAIALSSIYSALPDIVFSKDRNGVFISCNHAYEKLHGCDKSEIIGKSSWDLYEDKELARYFSSLDHTVFTEKRPVTEQSWKTFSDGSVRFLETTRVPLIQDGEVTGLIGIGRDLTESKNLLEQYKDQATTLSTIYSALPDIVFSKNRDGVFTSCSNVFEKFFALDKSEIIGKTAADILPDKEQAHLLMDQDNRVLNEKIVSKDQMWVAYPDGVTRYIDTIKTPLIQNGEVTGLLGIGRDMTEYKNLLDELGKTHKLTELMLDTIPFCCIMINKEHKCFACNSEATRLFKLKDKQEFLDQFDCLSPKYQPDGCLSNALIHVYFEKAFEGGKYSFGWLHQLLDGTRIPVQITLVRVNYNNDYAVIGYMRDMREHMEMTNEIEKQNTLLRTLNHVSAMLLDPEIEKFESNLFDSMSIIAEAIDVDHVSIWKNYTKGGEQLYCTMAYQWLSDKRLEIDIAVLPDISYNDNIPGCEELLAKGKCLNIMARTMAPQTQSPHEEILSAFAVPVFVRDIFWGFVAFDDRHNEHKFVQNEELILRSISRMIACTLIRNEMARDIHTTTSQLEVKATEARKASRAKSVFLAKMSHEIRTPMNAIAGMAELALREKEPDTVRRHIFTIKQASANLLSIINDILDITKIESGKMEIVLDNYLFSSLMNDVISIIKTRLIDSHLRFAVNIDSNIPNDLYGDETRVRQILLNLLSNAIKYTDEGFVSFTVTGALLDEENINLNITVRDSGRGIKQEDMNKLFEDFSQLDTAKNKSIEGTGLGLAITWNILKVMGGDIEVFSEYGKGSTFIVTLPQKFNSLYKLASVRNPEEKRVLVYERRDIYAASIINTLENLGVECDLVSTGITFRRKLSNGTYPFIFLAPLLYDHCKSAIMELAQSSTIVMLTEFGDTPPNDDFNILAMPAHCIAVANILNGVPELNLHSDSESRLNFTAPDARVLVVDDIKTNLTVTEGLLLPYKMQVDLCKSGAEAVDAVKDFHYDLVFMDHWMLEMDGVEATKCIRALGSEDKYYSDIPVIALTANAISGTRDMFIKNGFNDFLAKPIDTVKLNSILERWIPKKKQQKTIVPFEDETAAEAVSPVEIPEIKDLNIKKGIALTGGSGKRYLETLHVFYDDGIEKIRELTACIETGNVHLYSIHVHALKSAASNIGAEKLSNAAKDLEMAGKRLDFDFIKAHNAQFLSALESLLGEIHTGLSAQRESGEKAVTVQDAEALQTKLVTLKQSIEILDARMMNNTIDALLALNLPEHTAAAIQGISRNILIAEYDEALTLTETLIAEQG